MAARHHLRAAAAAAITAASTSAAAAATPITIAAAAAAAPASAAITTCISTATSSRLLLLLSLLRCCCCCSSCCCCHDSYYSNPAAAAPFQTDKPPPQGQGLLSSCPHPSGSGPGAWVSQSKAPLLLARAIASSPTQPQPRWASAWGGLRRARPHTVPRRAADSRRWSAGRRRCAGGPGANKTSDFKRTARHAIQRARGSLRIHPEGPRGEGAGGGGGSRLVVAGDAAGAFTRGGAAEACPSPGFPRGPARQLSHPRHQAATSGEALAGSQPAAEWRPKLRATRPVRPQRRRPVGPASGPAGAATHGTAGWGGWGGTGGELADQARVENAPPVTARLADQVVRAAGAPGPEPEAHADRVGQAPHQAHKDLLVGCERGWKRRERTRGGREGGRE